VSDDAVDPGPTSDVTQSSILSIAARNAFLVTGAVLGMGTFRIVLQRVFAIRRDATVLALLLLAATFGIAWFIYGFLCLRWANRRKLSPDPNTSATKKSVHFVRTFWTSAIIAFVVALCAWFALWLNDGIFYSRLLPWIPALIKMQMAGFITASRLYPCQFEGSSIGCKWYKWIPSFLGANFLAYFPFVFMAVACYMNLERGKAALQTWARRFIRWSVAISVAGLCALQIMHCLGLDMWDFQHATASVWHWQSNLWNLVRVVTGTIILICGLLLPFFSYRLLGKSLIPSEQAFRLRDVTLLAIVMLSAVTLGNVY
jgi:hypothetical protein